MYFSPMCTSKQLNWKTIITNYSPNIIHPGILPLRMRSSKLRMRISTPRIFMKSKLMCLIICLKFLKEDIENDLGKYSDLYTFR